MQTHSVSLTAQIEKAYFLSHDDLYRRLKGVFKAFIIHFVQIASTEGNLRFEMSENIRLSNKKWKEDTVANCDTIARVVNLFFLFFGPIFGRPSRKTQLTDEHTQLYTH